MILDSEEDLEIVGQAADGAEAVRLARTARPDVVLMDIRMPGMDGIAATRRLAGPDAVDPAAAELVQAVRVVADGQALPAPAITRTLLDESARRPERDTPDPVRSTC